MEACIRKVRYYEGNYYDSIRMGILREVGTRVEMQLLFFRYDIVKYCTSTIGSFFT